jgi:protein required for attachment to host cells
MHNPAPVWILVADCGCSRLLTWNAESADLIELEELTSNAEHPAAADSQIFATDLAEHLQQALNDGRYGQLILISPPEFLNVLRSKLSSDVCRCVAELIGLDMTASPSATIAARIPKHLKHG